MLISKYLSRSFSLPSSSGLTTCRLFNLMFVSCTWLKRLVFSRRMHHTHDFEGAVAKLNTLQSNAAAIQKWRETRTHDLQANLKAEMLRYLDYVSVDRDALAQKVVHVAGTKGKGSTCCMTESIIRSHNITTGLFTSPHLISVRERIRIDGKPIDEEKFAKYFWECYEKIEKHEVSPGYFRFLTVMAMKVFQEENVDAVILEVGIGGRTDSTNCLDSAVATGITTLDYDHTEVLGDTLAKIAGEKAGIMKEGVPVIVAPQVEEGMSVIRNRSKEVNAPLYYSSPLKDYLDVTKNGVCLSLQGNYQHINASVAIALANEFLKSKKNSENLLAKPTEKNSEPKMYPIFGLPLEFVEGLAKAEWPGRAQTLQREGFPHTTFFLDGAHTIESMRACLDWFEGRVKEHTAKKGKRPKTILCFNCKYEKDSDSMLNILHGENEIYFTASKLLSTKDHSNDITNVLDGQTTFQDVLRQKWISLFSKTDEKYENSEKTYVFPTINSCLDKLKDCDQKITEQMPTDSEDIFVLVTGSLYLVGGYLELLGFNTTK